MKSSGARPSGAELCLYGLVALVAACAPDLPNDQVLTSAHFRYHARKTAIVDPTILDRLEARREEFDARFGIESPFVDYYLFDDRPDLAANSPCPGRDCTAGAPSGSSIFTTAALHEHELVHGFLGGAGYPAMVVAEGIAQHVACVQPHWASTRLPASWPEAVRVGNDSGSAYNFGQRLSAWMLATRGPTAFISFYGESLQTRDPALFALQFESFWRRRLSEVAEEVNDARFEGSSCTCTAPALPDGGAPSTFVARQDYRTVELTGQSRLELRSNGPLVYPFSCANTVDRHAKVVPSAPTTQTIVRAGAGRFGVLAWPTVDGELVAVRRNTMLQSDWSCDAARTAPISVGKEDVALWVTADFASNPNGTFFAVDLEEPGLLTLLSEEGLATYCQACDRCGGFSSPGPVPVPAGPGFVRLWGPPTSAPGAPSVGVLVGHPPR